MTNEEEKETKTEMTAKKSGEIKPDPDLRSTVISSASSVKDKGKGYLRSNYCVCAIGSS